VLKRKERNDIINKRNTQADFAYYVLKKAEYTEPFFAFPEDKVGGAANEAGA